MAQEITDKWTYVVTIGHDFVETRIDFLCWPCQPLAVLSHFKTWNCDTTTVGCLCNLRVRVYFLYLESRRRTSWSVPNRVTTTHARWLEDVNSLLSAALKTHYQVTDFHRLQYRLTMLEPSATIRTPAPMSTEASSPDTSFWVAHGKAMWTLSSSNHGRLSA